MALVYPNSYYLGMSNLGIHAIYGLLNARSDVVCERVFLDTSHDAKGGPPLSVESQRPLSDFALVAFSVTYELDYFHIPSMLASSEIPIRASERNSEMPLIIAGGACIAANPLPVAPFFDCVCIGEAEAIMPSLLETVLEEIGSDREQMLALLADLPGIYVPGHTRGSVTRQWVQQIDAFPVHSEVLTRDTELGDMYLIEVERGCKWSCRFCLVCSTFRPMRSRSLSSLLDQAKTGLAYRPRLGLVGPDVSDHPQFEELLVKLKETGAQISVSSLRIRPLIPMALGELVRSGSGTVALGVEAGSDRLRKIIRKGITEDDIIRAMDIASEQDVKQLRLYFMIGLPTETDSDIEAIISLALKCKAVFEQRRNATRLGLSVAPFVPKAGTPFERLPMEETSVLNHRLARLKAGLQRHGIKVAGESPAWSEVQAVLARGDSRLAEVLSNTGQVSLASWRQAMRMSGVAADQYARRRWQPDDELPWEVIESAPGLDRLKLDVEKAVGN